MQVLVVGGTRFVGYQLVWRLVAGGHQVTILNRGKHPDPFGRRVERIVADRTKKAFDVALTDRRFDVVVDFAAFTARDVKRVLSVLGKKGLGHYIFISTGQVYLVREGCHTPAREEDYLGALIPEPTDRSDRDNWLYGMNKRAAEDALVLAWATNGFPATRLRLPMINGERDYHRRIESYLWRILDGGPIILPDGGENVVRHVYSGDVVKIIAGILHNFGTFGEVYNLAQDRMPTLAEFVVLLAQVVGAPVQLVSASSEALRDAGLKPESISPFSEKWMSCLDPSKARMELHFRPEGLRDYLDKIVTDFLNHPPAEPPENYATRQKELELAQQATIPEQ